MLTAVFGMFLGLAAGSGAVEVPPYIHFSAILTDPAGAPVNGQMSIKVRLYQDESGGEAVFEEDFQAVMARDGLLGLTIGSRTDGGVPAGLFAAGEIWLGVTVEADQEMTPRLRIMSVPFAYLCMDSGHAGDADTLQGNAADDFAQVQHNHSWSELTAVPQGFADGTDGMRTDAEITGLAKDACYDTEDELTTALEGTYASESHIHQWSEIEDIPEGFADSTDDMRTDAEITGLAKAACFDTKDELTTALFETYASSSHAHLWSEVGEIPEGFADGTDNDHTYDEIAAIARDVCYDSPEELHGALDTRYSMPSHNHGGLAWGDSCGPDTPVSGCSNICGDGTMTVIKWRNLNVGGFEQCTATMDVAACHDETGC